MEKFIKKRKHLRVAICSREPPDSYNWLLRLLERADFKKKVNEINPVHISNDFSRFQKDISGYTFAVLYHSKRRGRINVTDVTDSLYDKELDFMHQSLGKERVIVVIDDLDDSSESEKNRILQSQKSIGQLACDLFLFSTNDKDSISSANKTPDVDTKIDSLYQTVREAKKVINGPNLRAGKNKMKKNKRPSVSHRGILSCLR
ncbi:uncharacterized protein LOC121398215 [Xenopus laevis]|uniref:Uncharacterized protein n=2 Tax=Xenopus laevis TaxID=8355 RepID=A0AA97PYZ7_XENLA|nr:uncharacterized protein LOC121398215 [Xenopus laevis]OCT56403.1 hypothetical protein XELAEV_18000156mg [Xenopus laevis]